MSINLSVNANRQILDNSKTIKEKTNIETEQVSIICDSSNAITDMKDTVLDERTGEVADILYKKGQKTSNIGTGVFVGGVTATVGGVAFALAASNPVGWVIGGVGLLAGAVVAPTIIHKGEVSQEEADNYHAPTKDEIEKRPRNNPVVSVVNTVVDPSTPDMPSKKDLANASKKLEDGSNGQYVDIYIHNNTLVAGDGSVVNKNSQLGQVDFVHTDLTKYDKETTTFGSYEGYQTEKYTFANEYTQVLNTFSAETSVEKINDSTGEKDVQVYSLTGAEAEKMEQIASALQLEGFEEEKAIFDINKDGHMNTADSMTLNFIANGKKDVFNSIIKEWKATEGNIELAIVNAYVQTLDDDIKESVLNQYNNTGSPSEKRSMANSYLTELTEGLYTNINSFDINKDYYSDDIDLDCFLDDDGNNNMENQKNIDINGDNKTDDKDVKILDSYLKANMDRLQSLEEEATDIREVTIEGGKVSEEYKRELRGE